ALGALLILSAAAIVGVRVRALPSLGMLEATRRGPVSRMIRTPVFYCPCATNQAARDSGRARHLLFNRRVSPELPSPRRDPRRGEQSRPSSQRSRLSTNPWTISPMSETYFPFRTRRTNFRALTQWRHEHVPDHRRPCFRGVRDQAIPVPRRTDPGGV